jgi:hypothetical protein
MKTKLLLVSIFITNVLFVFSQCPTNASAAISSLPYTQTVGDITTAGNDFSSSDACGGNWMTGEDYTYTYTPLVNECIDVIVNGGAYYGLFITDGCPNSATANCIDEDYIYGAGVLSVTDIPVTGGTTYYITVSYWPPSSSSFDISVNSHVCHIPPTPGNCTDMTINSTMYSQVGLTTCGFGDDFDQNDACGSFYMGGDDIVIEYIPTTTECVSISLTNTNIYTGIFIMDGCAFDAGVNCLASNTNSSGSPSIQLFEVTAGTSYFIHISTNPNPQCTSFDLNITTCPPISACGNVATNDYCSDPVTLTQSTSDWTNTTNDGYTPDEPSNMIDDFCGSIENNSWYAFTALSTTESFVFSGINGTYCGSGIQALVYDVTKDADGCCTNFDLVSNCYNPVSLAGGTVTATSLVVGKEYYLMIDGNTGSGCDYTISNWGPVILTVSLVDFTGYQIDNENKLEWTTASENNNDHFIIQKSEDGQTFTELGTVDGHGNSNVINNYEFSDKSPLAGYSYYRLKQVDFDGESAFSNVIVVEAIKDHDVRIYPNPFKDQLTIKLNDFDIKELDVEILNQFGSTIYNKTLASETGSVTIDFNQSMSHGFYFVKVKIGNQVIIEKLIKD